MTTDKKIQANRINALASTGPKTDKGKASVAQNAIKWGVFSTRPVVNGTECQQEWNEFRDSIVADLHPTGAFEHVLADRVAGCLWRLRRVTVAEAATIEMNQTFFIRALLAGGKENVVKEVLETQGERKEVEEVTQQARQDLQEWECAMQFFARLREADENEAVSGSRLVEWLVALTAKAGLGVPGNLIDTPAFLKHVKPPATPKKELHWDRPGWTVGHARRALAFLEQQCARPLSDLIEEIHRERQKEVTDFEAELTKLDEGIVALADTLRNSQAIPDTDSAAKIARYESHLSRQLSQALHELQRLQASRTGALVPPPATLDVTIHGAESSPINDFAKQSQYSCP